MTCAKNCKNWWMCVKAIARQTWDIFERHCINATPTGRQTLTLASKMPLPSESYKRNITTIDNSVTSSLSVLSTLAIIRICDAAIASLKYCLNTSVIYW